MKKFDHKKIKSFRDIEIAKGKLRYEMLIAENQLHENIMGIERIFTITSFINRFATGFSTAHGAFSRATDLFGKIFRRKAKKEAGVSQGPIDFD